MSLDVQLCQASQELLDIGTTERSSSSVKLDAFLTGVYRADNLLCYVLTGRFPSPISLGLDKAEQSALQSKELSALSH